MPAVNERSYWLIEMNIKKTLQVTAFRYLVLNLVEEVVLLQASNYRKEVEKVFSRKLEKISYLQKQPPEVFCKRRCS